MTEKFWIMESPEPRTAVWDGGNLWRRCDYYPSPAPGVESEFVKLGGPADRQTDLRIVLTVGDVPDFVWTVTDCVLRGRVLDIFRDAGLTGFGVRPVAARFEEGIDAEGSVTDLWELQVTGWGGVARAQSGVRRVGGTSRWEGHPDWVEMVDWSAWDGSDFFIVWPFPYVRLVSDRVARLIRKEKLAGVNLITPRAFTRNFARWRIDSVTPLPLRHHFPDARAREVGESIGIY